MDTDGPNESRGRNARSNEIPTRPSSVPMVGQVMSAARGATDAFSGVSRHVNDALWKFGAKNVKAGIGCGAGFGHGFGVGFGVKPNALQKIQSCFVLATARLMMKLGMVPTVPFDQNKLPVSLQKGVGLRNELSKQNPVGNAIQSKTQAANLASQALSGYQNVEENSPPEKTGSSSRKFTTRTEQVINDFLQNPHLAQQDTKVNQLVGQLQSENNVLQMVLKHQQIIEELMEENEKLRNILIEDLKVPPVKLEFKSSTRYRYPCTDCFECRRKQKRNR